MTVFEWLAWLYVTPLQWERGTRGWIRTIKKFRGGPACPLSAPVRCRAPNVRSVVKEWHWTEADVNAVIYAADNIRGPAFCPAIRATLLAACRLPAEDS